MKKIDVKKGLSMQVECVHEQRESNFEAHSFAKVSDLCIPIVMGLFLFFVSLWVYVWKKWAIIKKKESKEIIKNANNILGKILDISFVQIKQPKKGGDV